MRWALRRLVAHRNFFKNKGFNFPPEYEPLAPTTPGTPGGLIYMLANYGTMSLEQSFETGHANGGRVSIEAQAANIMERDKSMIKEWPYSRKVFYRIQVKKGGEAGFAEAGSFFFKGIYWKR